MKRSSLVTPKSNEFLLKKQGNKKKFITMNFFVRNFQNSNAQNFNTPLARVLLGAEKYIAVFRIMYAIPSE